MLFVKLCFLVFLRKTFCLSSLNASIQCRENVDGRKAVVTFALLS